MVSCPKCSFTQPADQYCASCGVDMQAWKPREKPFLVRLGTNTIFQIVVVTVVVAGTFAYMRETRRSELAARVRAIEIARQAEEVDQEIAAAQAPRPRATNNASTGAPRPMAAQPQAAPPPSQANANVADTSTSSNYSATASMAGASFAASTEGKPTVPTSARVGAPTAAQITFYEMSRTLTTALMQNASQTGAEGPVSMGVVTAFEARLRQQTFRAFDSANQALQVNQPALVFKGARDQATGANIGFTIQINPVGLDEAGAQIQVEITRVLKDQATTGVDEASFAPSETFLVPKGGALVLVGVLQRKTPTEAETNFYKSIGSLRILTSPSFIQGQSEAVLVIEAK